MKTPLSIALRIAVIIFGVLSVTLALAFGLSEYELTGRYVEIFEARKDAIISSPEMLQNIAKEPRRFRLQDASNSVGNGKNHAQSNWENLPFAPNTLKSDAIPNEGQWPNSPDWDISSNRDSAQNIREIEKIGLQKGFSRNIILESTSGSVSVYGNLRSESVEKEFIDALPLNTLVSRSLDKDEYFFYAFTLSSGERIVLYESLEFVREMRGNYIVFAAIGLVFFSILLFVVSFRIAKDSLKPLEEAIDLSRSYNRYMAHELKTPIAVISSNLELAKRSTNPLSYVDSSLDELSWMKSSIDKLLFLSGKEFHLSKKKTEISSIVTPLITELSRLFGREDLIWKEEYLTKEIQCDPAFFKLFVRNCLENIFKYAKSGEVRMVLEGKTLLFENAADTIDEKKLASFFEASESYGGKGYGIGLSIVKRIADLHNWKVHLVSGEGKFRIQVEL